MKNLKEFTFLSSDGKTNISAYRYEAENPRCTLQISHGIAEYAKRYEPFADYLTANGITVYANDHLGHGGSVASEENRMFFAEKNGWDHVVSDLKTLSDIVSDENSRIYLILFLDTAWEVFSQGHISLHILTILTAQFCAVRVTWQDR